MIADIDDAIKELLIRDIPLRKSEVDITFDQPKREWSTQLNKPTLNLYLFDLKENVELRASEQLITEKREDGMITIKRNPVRMDLHYLLTSWTRDTQDQHRLLSGALIALLRHPTYPIDMLPETLKNQPVPIRLKVAQPDVMGNITDLWSTLDNEIRPGIRLTVTVSIEPLKPDVFPPISTLEFQFQQPPSPDAVLAAGEPLPNRLSRNYFTIRGKVRSQKYSLSVLKMIMRENAQEIQINPEGEYHIARLQEGEYHLDILTNGRVLKQQKLVVPSSTYEIEV